MKAAAGGGSDVQGALSKLNSDIKNFKATYDRRIEAIVGLEALQ